MNKGLLILVFTMTVIPGAFSAGDDGASCLTFLMKDNEDYNGETCVDLTQESGNAGSELCAMCIMAEVNSCCPAECKALCDANPDVEVSIKQEVCKPFIDICPLVNEMCVPDTCTSQQHG